MLNYRAYREYYGKRKYIQISDIFISSPVIYSYHVLSIEMALSNCNIIKFLTKLSLPMGMVCDSNLDLLKKVNVPYWHSLNLWESFLRFLLPITVHFQPLLSTHTLFFIIFLIFIHHLVQNFMAANQYKIQSWALKQSVCVCLLSA